MNIWPFSDRKKHVAERDRILAEGAREMAASTAEVREAVEAAEVQLSMAHPNSMDLAFDALQRKPERTVLKVRG